MLVPETIEKKLHEKLRLIQRRGYLIDRDSFEYQTLAREARKLVSAEPAVGYATLGALCGLAGDIEGVRLNYEKALRLDGAPMFRHNYAVALLNLGFFSEGAKHIALLERPEIGFLGKAIVLTIECARFRRAVNLIDKWNEIHNDELRDLGCLTSAADLVERKSIPEDAFLPCLDVAGEVLRENKLIFYDEPIIEVINDEGGEEISFRFLLTASAKTAVKMETELVDRLFDAGINVYESVIRLGFLSMGEQSQQTAA